MSQQFEVSSNASCVQLLQDHQVVQSFSGSFLHWNFNGEHLQWKSQEFTLKKTTRIHLTHPSHLIWLQVPAQTLLSGDTLDFQCVKQDDQWYYTHESTNESTNESTLPKSIILNVDDADVGKLAWIQVAIHVGYLNAHDIIIIE